MNDVLQLIRCKPVIAGCLQVIKRVQLTCVSCQIDKELKVLRCLHINPLCHHNTLFPNNQISITLILYPVSQSMEPISILTALCYSSLHSQKWLKRQTVWSNVRSCGLILELKYLDKPWWWGWEERQAVIGIWKKPCWASIQRVNQQIDSHLITDRWRKGQR